MTLVEVVEHMADLLPYLITLTIFAAALTYFKKTLDRIEDD